MKAKQLKLLVFQNDWCAQCYTERPVVRAVQRKFSELNVKMIDAEEKLNLARKYQIQSAPSLVLLKDNKIVERINRFINQEQLEKVIRYYL